MKNILTATVFALGLSCAGQAIANNDTTSNVNGNDRNAGSVVGSEGVINDFLDLTVNAADNSQQNDNSQRTNNSQQNDNSQRSISGSFNSVSFSSSTSDQRSTHNGDVVVADQSLRGVITNNRQTRFQQGYESGANTVRGNAFAAYAGILNQAWNTGVNANTQAATNVAARGTVTFTNGN